MLAQSSLVPRVDSSTHRSIVSTSYDTAWVASLPDPADPNRPRFPAALQWVVDHQLPDGSWGGAIRYQHDRIISTLAALLPLMRFSQSDHAQRALRRAQSYIWQHAHTLPHEASELVGFELLLPALVRQANQAGIELPSYLDVYAEQRARKLALVPADLLYSPRVTLVHSLEFLGEDVDPIRLLAAQGANGSVGNSPAATAFLLHYIEDPAALGYLRGCLADDNGAAVPVLHPCETFDLLWSAYHRFLGGMRGRLLLPDDACAALRSALDSGAGISLSPSFRIPDADDTAVALLLLAASGQLVCSTALDSFEREGYYVSFPYERHPSVGVNIHVLDALKWMPPGLARDAKIAKLLAFLADTRVNRTYWTDKWHISPYYATAHAIVALANLPAPHATAAAELANTALDWIRYTQNADGSWGFYDSPTSEETAYALLALSRWRYFRRAGDQSMIQRGASYLMERRGNVHPPLWIDKCLYTPTAIVTAAVEAAVRSARASTAELGDARVLERMTHRNAA
jgi:halimadienyl-diphosphate synthase